MTDNASPSAESAWFDGIIHAYIHFRSGDLINVEGEVSFAAIRDSLEASDATCSKHLKVLTQAGYVVQSKRGGEGAWGLPDRVD